MAKKEWGLIEPISKIKETQKEVKTLMEDLATAHPRKKKEVLTETEKELVWSIFDAYKKQYRTKSTLRYKTAVSLEKKFTRMKLLKEVETS